MVFARFWKIHTTSLLEVSEPSNCDVGQFLDSFCLELLDDSWGGLLLEVKANNVLHHIILSSSSWNNLCKNIGTTRTSDQTYISRPFSPTCTATFIEILYFSRRTRTLMTRALPQFLIFLYAFGGLAIAADHLCNAMETLCDHLKLPEDVGGATFMALGGSIPEICVNTIVSVKQAASGSALSPADAQEMKDQVNLGVGAILGSGLIAFLAIPACCILFVGEVTLKRRPFLRDVVFYLLCLLCLGFAVHAQTVKWGLAVSFILVYCLYVATIVFGRRVRAAGHRWTGRSPLLTRQVSNFRERAMDRQATLDNLEAAANRRSSVRSSSGGDQDRTPSSSSTTSNMANLENLVIPEDLLEQGVLGVVDKKKVSSEEEGSSSPSSGEQERPPSSTGTGDASSRKNKTVLGGSASGSGASVLRSIPESGTGEATSSTAETVTQGGEDDFVLHRLPSDLLPFNENPPSAPRSGSRSPSSARRARCTTRVGPDTSGFSITPAVVEAVGAIDLDEEEEEPILLEKICNVIFFPVQWASDKVCPDCRILQPRENW